MTENGTFSLQELIILKLITTTLLNTFECSAIRINIIKFYYFNIQIGTKYSLCTELGEIPDFFFLSFTLRCVLNERKGMGCHASFTTLEKIST